MLTGKLIHPHLIEAIALCGHGSKILIADGNYPLKLRTSGAKRIYLGLTPGTPTVTQVLDTLQSVLNFEAAVVMAPEDGREPPIFSEFQRMLPGITLKPLDRCAFYEACTHPDVELAVSTGEQRTFSNLLLTVGCA